MEGGGRGDDRPDLCPLGGGRLKLITKMLSTLAPLGVALPLASLWSEAAEANVPINACAS